MLMRLTMAPGMTSSATAPASAARPMVLALNFHRRKSAFTTTQPTIAPREKVSTSAIVRMPIVRMSTLFSRTSLVSPQVKSRSAYATAYSRPRSLACMPSAEKKVREDGSASEPSDTPAAIT